MKKKNDTLENIKNLKEEIVEVQNSLRAVKINDVKDAVENKKTQFKEEITQNLHRME